MKPKTRQKHNNNSTSFKKVKSLNNSINKSQSIKIPKKVKETFKKDQIKNDKIYHNNNIQNNNNTTTIKNNIKDKQEKKVGGRSASAKPIQIQVKNNNNYNKNIYEKILAFKKKEKEKSKNRTNSAISKKNQKSINKDNINNKPKIINNNLYINEKDLSELEKNNDNCLNNFLNIIQNHGQIECETFNILNNFNNNKNNKYIYIKLFELLNNIFEKLSFYSKNEINFFMKNDLNKLVQKSLQLLLSYHSIIFVNVILLSVNDSITILNNQCNIQFKKVSKIIFNIFYKYIYVDLKNRNLFQKNLSNFKDFIENQLNQLVEKNKYKLNINSKNKSVDPLISNLNKLIDTCFVELKEITETMRLSPISPVANSIKLLINSFNKKNLSSFIDIINNVILYSLLNKNLERGYKNMLADKNSDIQIVYSRNSVPYLPPITKDKIYTLVLDLDETLIHFFSSKVDIRGDPHYGFFSSDEEYGLFNNYLIDDKIEKEKIDEDHYEFLKIGMFLLRPYVKQFLGELNNYYEIEIFTTGTKEYCDRVLQLLDLDNNLIKYRLYKHHIALKDINISVKDLSLLGRDLSKTIIVDNLEENFRLQPDNGLPIITWKGDIHDYSLKYLTQILKSIVINKAPDVRKIVKKIKKQIKSEKNPSYSKVNINTLF